MKYEAVETLVKTWMVIVVIAMALFTVSLIVLVNKSVDQINKVGLKGVVERVWNGEGK